jgi:hypothetical protein
MSETESVALLPSPTLTITSIAVFWLFPLVSDIIASFVVILFLTGINLDPLDASVPEACLLLLARAVVLLCILHTKTNTLFLIFS